MCDHYVDRMCYIHEVSLNYSIRKLLVEGTKRPFITWAVLDILSSKIFLMKPYPCDSMNALHYLSQKHQSPHDEMISLEMKCFKVFMLPQ